MSYELASLISVTLFALIHLFSGRLSRFNLDFQSKFLSTAGGVAIAYVFIDLLPKLCKNDLMVRQSLHALFPYFERHVFIMALFGFLLFYLVDRRQNEAKTYWLSISSYALFNFLIGYAIVDKNDPEVKPLVLFTIAMGLHYFVNDFTLTRDHAQYRKSGRWILVACLLLGWIIGLFSQLPTVAIALVTAFIGGGVIMNVIRHELPKENPNNNKAFLFSALAYMLILLFIG